MFEEKCWALKVMEKCSVQINWWTRNHYWQKVNVDKEWKNWRERCNWKARKIIYLDDETKFIEIKKKIWKSVKNKRLDLKIVKLTLTETIKA